MHWDEHDERSFALLTGKLSDEEAIELQQHLDACPDCRARHAEEAELLAALDRPTEGLAGETLVAAVMADVEAVPGRASRPQVVQLNPWAARAWLPLLAAAAVALSVWWSGPAGGGWAAALSSQLAVARASLAAWTADWTAMAQAAGESGAAAYRASQAAAAVRCPGFDGCVEVAAAALLLACIGLIAGFRRTSARSH